MDTNNIIWYKVDGKISPLCRHCLQDLREEGVFAENVEREGSIMAVGLNDNEEPELFYMEDTLIQPDWRVKCKNCGMELMDYDEEDEDLLRLLIAIADA